MAVQSIVLENHGYVPVFGRHAGAVFAVYYELAVGDIFKAGNHAERS